MSDPIKDGGPAFPCNRTVGPTNGTVEDFRAYGTGDEGMFLRDWFAGQALAGMMAAMASNDGYPVTFVDSDYEPIEGVAGWYKMSGYWAYQGHSGKGGNLVAHRRVTTFAQAMAREAMELADAMLVAREARA